MLASVLLIAACLIPASTGYAAEKDEFQYRTVTTSEGLSFRIPEDMPIENRNGIQTPIPFDEYMYGKFKQMENRLNSMDVKLDAIQQLLSAAREENGKRALASQ